MQQRPQKKSSTPHEEKKSEQAEVKAPTAAHSLFNRNKISNPPSRFKDESGNDVGDVRNLRDWLQTPEIIDLPPPVGFPLPEEQRIVLVQKTRWCCF